MDETENSEITTVSQDVPTVSLRLDYDSIRCYYGATTVAPGQSYYIRQLIPPFTLNAHR